MGYAKSVQKREYILDCAKTIFLQKGFAQVTMKDIVDACGISRGGLYRYFNSTREIFLALFQREAEKEMQQAKDEIHDQRSARWILNHYLAFQKKQILEKEPSLTHAAYEFFLENPDDQIIYQWQFDGTAEMFREILDYGCRKGEFVLEDTAALARHLALFLNNLYLSSPLLNLPEPHIEEQFKLLLKPLVKNVKKA